MAYLDTSDVFSVATRVPLAEAIEARFDPREWRVIALARWDGLASLRAPSRLARLFQRLFGGDGGDRRLADTHLEALRRFAVLAWHYGYTLPVSAMKALKAEGYTPDHIELLLATVSAYRAPRARRQAA